MSKKVLFITIFFIAIVFFGLYKIWVDKSTASAELKVVASPNATIFLDDKMIGKTPFDEKQKNGEYILKLIPEEASANFSTWQGKISLYPSVLTYVKRDLGPSELTSAGEIVTLEKIKTSTPQISVSSTPDGLQVLIDGQERGISPLTVDSSPGEHEVTVSATGFTARSIRIATIENYKVVVNFQLALSSVDQLQTLETPTEATQAGKIATTTPAASKPYVLIKDTPTGFLRVRLDASLAATEVAQLKPGDKVEFLEEKEGWFKVLYSDGKEGWVSQRYAQIVE